MMIPQEIEATWHSNSGEFSYAKFRLTNIEYDNLSKYYKARNNNVPRN
jgi:hypothetical protein